MNILVWSMRKPDWKLACFLNVRESVRERRAGAELSCAGGGAGAGAGGFPARRAGAAWERAPTSSVVQRKSKTE